MKSPEPEKKLLWRRTVVVSLALLLPFAQVLSGAHFALHQHVWCAEHAAVEHHESGHGSGACHEEHGTQVHGSAEDGHLHRHEGGPASETCSLVAGEPRASDGHHACPIPYASRDGEVLELQLPDSGFETVLALREPGPALPDRSGISPVQYAPKHSPPVA